MRHGFSLVLVVACMGMLSACTKAVVGPDLAHRPTPFVAEGTVDLSDTFGVMQATIIARPEGDTATVRFDDIGERPYNATVTYHAFVPIIAESNADRKDYWLIGLNLTQTPDRSFYAIMRYPHGKGLQPDTARDDFEFRVLNCGPYHPKAKAAEEDGNAAAQAVEETRTDIPANQVRHTETDTLCLFHRRNDVEQHANWILQQDDMLRREAMRDPEMVTDNGWSRLKVVTR